MYILHSLFHSFEDFTILCSIIFSGEFSNVYVIELRNQLTEKIEEQTRNTDEIIRKFVEQRNTALKQYITRANDDFQVLKKCVLLSMREVCFISAEDPN